MNTEELCLFNKMLDKFRNAEISFSLHYYESENTWEIISQSPAAGENFMTGDRYFLIDALEIAIEKVNKLI